MTSESAEYLAKREELRKAEIESIKMRERVAQLWRELPLGAAVQDYEFVESPADPGAGDAPTRTVRLSELFTRGCYEGFPVVRRDGRALSASCPIAFGSVQKSLVLRHEECAKGTTFLRGNFPEMTPNTRVSGSPLFGNKPPCWNIGEPAGIAWRGCCEGVPRVFDAR